MLGDLQHLYLSRGAHVKIDDDSCAVHDERDVSSLCLCNWSWTSPCSSALALALAVALALALALDLDRLHEAFRVLTLSVESSELLLSLEESLQESSESLEEDSEESDELELLELLES